MKEIIVLAEHRRGEMRDVTWEMLSKARQLAESIGAEIAVALLGKGINQLAEVLKPKAHRVLLIEDDRLEAYNSETYEKVLTQVITERKPFLTLIAHTAMGMDFAPSLAAHLKMPLATDCIGIDAAEGTFSLTRQLYSGKVNATVSFLKKGPYMVTVRAGAFPVAEKDALPGEMVYASFTLDGRRSWRSVFCSMWRPLWVKSISPRPIFWFRLEGESRKLTTSQWSRNLPM